jgi:hypothetical protein
VFLRQGRGRRGASGCGEVDGVFYELDCVQARRRESAGVVVRAGVLRPRSWASIPYDIDQKKNMMRCARTGEEEWTRERARNTGGSSESTNYCSGCCGLRRGIIVDLAAVFEKDQREMREEREGVL